MRIAATAVAVALAPLAAAGAQAREHAPGRLVLATQAADRISTGAGDDRVVTWGDGRADAVACGAGSDLVAADPADRAGGGCETVVLRLSRDRSVDPRAQHATQVEPSSAAAGRTVVAVFQNGRFRDGGAAAIGFATSTDAGASWRDGALRASPRYPRQSDPVVAYDAARGAWLAATLGLAPGAGSALLVHRSADGLAWEDPLEAAADPDPEGGIDKQWLACDGGRASPFRGRCYLAYTDVHRRAVALRRSDDGGRSWSEPAYGPAVPGGLVGALPVVRPDGSLLVLATEGGRVGVLRSPDGGATLARSHRFPLLARARLPGLRSPVLAAADVDAAGRVVAVWHGCASGRPCRANAVVLAESGDGVSWSAPRELPTREVGSAFVPAVALAPSGGGAAVLFYAARGCPACRVDAWLAESPDRRGWGRPLRLSPRGMRRSWLPRTSLGAMLGDYVAVTWTGARPLPVLSLAEPPGPDGRLRQAVFAGSRLEGLRSRPGARRS